MIRRALWVRRGIICTVVSLSLGVAFVMPAFASDGTFVSKWGTGPSAAAGNFNRPHDIAMGPSGDVYVLDTLNQRVQRFTDAGVFVSSFNVGGGTAIYGLGVDSAGAVYVADSTANAVRKYSAAGTLQLTITGITTARDVATDASGNIYVVSQTGYVRRYNSAGSSFVTLVTGLSGPRCIAVAPSGSFYVTEFGANYVSRYSGAGALEYRWGGTGVGDGQFNGDVGIGLGPDGNVYTTEIGNDRVQKFSATGVFIAKWGSAGTGDGQFTDPRGVAIDGSNNAYVADTDNHRVQKFGVTAPPPVVSTPASSWWSVGLGLMIAFGLVAISWRRSAV